MAVKNRLKNICLHRGINNPHQLRIATGLSQGTCSRFWNEDSYIPDGSVMNTVCQKLGIQPGDFLIYEDN